MDESEDEGEDKEKIIWKREGGEARWLSEGKRKKKRGRSDCGTMCLRSFLVDKLW
jgi:hypothetical protein